MPASIRHLTNRRINYYSLLARWKDGLYYTAALIRCDKAAKRCRICFEDGSEIWTSNRDVHLQLQADKLTEDEDIVCCVCDDGSSEAPNEIILCDVCNQGYHQKCHTPPVDSSKLDGSDDAEQHIDWFCATCSFILNQTNCANLGAAAQKQRQQGPQQQQADNPPVELRGATKSKPTSEAPKALPAPAVAAPTTTVAPKTDEQTSQKSKNAINGRPTQQAVVVTPKSQPPKVKQTPTIEQQQQHKSTIGAIKPSAGHHQRSAPYYPLSSQARTSVAASASPTASTAALASMTASSALVVGSSAGRTKQDLVKQSNRSSQRQLQRGDAGTLPAPSAAVTSASVGPPKHAVRKSGVNFVVSTTDQQPVRQSALPTATRSTPSAAVVAPMSVQAKVKAAGSVSATIVQNKNPQQITISSPVTSSTIPSRPTTSIIVVPKVVPTQLSNLPARETSGNGIEPKYSSGSSSSGGIGGSGAEPRSVVATAAAAAKLVPTPGLIEPKKAANYHTMDVNSSSTLSCKVTVTAASAARESVVKAPSEPSTECKRAPNAVDWRPAGESSAPRSSVNANPEKEKTSPEGPIGGGAGSNSNDGRGTGETHNSAGSVKGQLST